MLNPTTMIHPTLRLTAAAALAGLLFGAEAASAKTNNFLLGLGRVSTVKCTIAGPTEFRNANVTNLSQRIFRRRYHAIYWQVKIGRQIKSGRTRLWTDLGPGGTISIPLGTGGGGTCHATIRRVR